MVEYLQFSLSQPTKCKWHVKYFKLRLWAQIQSDACNKTNWSRHETSISAIGIILIRHGGGRDVSGLDSLIEADQFLLVPTPHRPCTVQSSFFVCVIHANGTQAWIKIPVTNNLQVLTRTRWKCVLYLSKTVFTYMYYTLKFDLK